MASRDATVRIEIGADPAIVELLTEIRDRLPVPPEKPAKTLGASDLKWAASHALYTLLVNLNGWIEDAQFSHKSNNHRDENRGDECWRRFAPADIRTMINDAARELGLSEFPLPALPKEDTP